MRFYTQQHRFYCGVDLHARTLSVCVLDQTGQVVAEATVAASPATFLKAVAPFRDGLVVGCECLFAWYWLADLCEDHQIPFVLGHALYMRMIHGGKAKTDKIDAAKLASMLRGGLFPMAYVYPRAKRPTRDLLRRRSFFVRQRAQLITHIMNTNTQFNLPPLSKKLTYAANRSPAIDPVTFGLLRTVPGIGPILGLILLYEIDDIARFPEAGNFLSYSRLVRCAHVSAGKVKGSGGRKIGNARLKWAFSEAACLMLRSCLPVKAWMQRQEKKKGKRKALSILEAKLGRTVYHLWRKQAPSMPSAS